MEPPRKKFRPSNYNNNNIVNNEDFKSDQSTFPQLPEELLGIIFGYLTNSQDLMNVCSATKRFATILERSKLKWLFGEVLGILLAQEKAKNHHQVDRFDTTSPPLTIHLFNGGEGHSKLLRWQQFTDYFLEQQKCNPDYNPIPSRRIHIHFQRDISQSDREAYFEQVSKYLQAFGQHVLYLTVQISNGVRFTEGFWFFYPILCKWAAMMPSLEFLALDFAEEFPCAQVSEHVPSFPHLKCLKNCQFDFSGNCAYHILHSNTHVRKVVLKHCSALPRIMKLNFTSQLVLKLLEVSVDQIYKIRTVPQNIYKLSLKCGGSIHNIKQFMMLIRMLKKSTIRCLDLDISSVNYYGDPIQEMIDLPQLKHLRLKLFERSLVDLDWLLGNLESLQTLTMEISDIKHIFVPIFSDESLDEENNQDFEVDKEVKAGQLAGSRDKISADVSNVSLDNSVSEDEDKPWYLDQFYRTNIWDNLPCLKTVTIKTCWSDQERHCFKLRRFNKIRKEAQTLTFRLFHFAM